MKPETYLRQKKTAALEKLYSQAFEKKEQLEVWKGAGTILPSIDHRNRPMGNKGGVVDVHENSFLCRPSMMNVLPILSESVKIQTRALCIVGISQCTGDIS